MINTTDIFEICITKNIGSIKVKPNHLNVELGETGLWQHLQVLMWEIADAPEPFVTPTNENPVNNVLKMMFERGWISYTTLTRAMIRMRSCMSRYELTAWDMNAPKTILPKSEANRFEHRNSLAILTGIMAESAYADGSDG